MAGRLILFKNENAQIKGDCQAEGYTDQLELSELSFASTAYVQSDSGTGTVHQTAVDVTVPFGPWIAEIQQKLYQSTMLGDVTIVEVEQKVDGPKKTWKMIREIHLLDGWIEHIQQDWQGIGSAVHIRLGYTDMTFSAGDKMAHFNRSEKS